jgi:site-specific recombinase XerD
MTTELEPISPAEAKEMYLEARKREVSESTLSGYHYRLKHFIRWCQEVEGFDNMNDLTGRKLQQFKTWRRDDGDLKPITLEGNLDALRVFIRWCESIDAVQPGLHEKFEALMPSLDKNEERSDAMLDAQKADDVLIYLRQFEYASREHVTVELLWHTGMRLGALHALDVDDYHAEHGRLEIRHRPETATPLKNGKEGERMVALSPDLCNLLDAWIEHQRPEATDDHDREPLLTSAGGRRARSNIRETVYKVTRPCYYTDECPEGREIETCEGACYTGYSKCPVNESPHAIRRGSITHFLSEDVPEKVVSDRMNVEPDTLDKHYDKRSEEQKVEQRRTYTDEV